MKSTVTVLALLIMFTTPCFASLRVVGKGDSMAFDSTGFPPNMQANYGIMKTKCVKCHSMERLVVAISTGVAPITGQPFDKNAARAYGAKMVRKTESNMNRQQVKQVVDLMNWLIDEAAK